MSDSKPVSLAPHLWEALELMSSEVGVEPDALIAQAVFSHLRLNGYVVPGRAGELVAAAPAAPAAPSRATGASSRAAPPGIRARAPAPEPEPEPPEEEENPFDQQDDEPYDEPPPDEEPPPEDEPYDEPEPEPEPEPPPPPPRRGGGAATLTLIYSGRDPYRMTSESFTIGRGKACDFVIDSNRVSREHVRILKEGADFILEDLNSSNGTFYGPAKSKISRQKIKDGDEFTLGTEKLKFQIRK